MSRVPDALHSAVALNLLHGTPGAAFERFDLFRADDRCPFGPAIYLTADILVAGCYERQGGRICEVEIKGPAGGVLDLDLNMSRQHVTAARVVDAMLAGLNLGRSRAINAREVIELADERLGKRHRNRLLASLGVWMLHGHVSAWENSGLQDRGRQYAVLDTACVLQVRWL